MKILVVGTGSIGTRHRLNLERLGVDVVSYSYRAAAAGSVSGQDYGMRMVDNLHAALRMDFDAVVIANQTARHMDVALEAAAHGRHLFIEKPLAVSNDGVGELLALVHQQALVVEAGYMLRFHPNLLFIKQLLDGEALGEIMHLRASVGQWLPDWRPGTDYRRGYSAFRKNGGGVIFDLVHELDLVQWLVGRVVEVGAMTRMVDCLDIETEAIAHINMRTSSGVLAQVSLDYVRPGYGRSLEIVGRKGVLHWDYLSGTVSLFEPDGSLRELHRVPSGFERNTLFLSHMEHFIQRICNPLVLPASSLDDSIAVMRTALACHRAAIERRCIRPEEIDAYCET